jgi:signal transduction histidine kinase
MKINELQVVIFIVSIVFFTILAVVTVLFFLFQKKKIAFLLKEQKQKEAFSETLIKSQIEIKENTLKGVAWELHDNIGQLLSLASMQLKILKMQDSNPTIIEISDIVSKSLQEIRMLAKTLNQEVVHAIGIEKAIQIEIDRFNRLNFIDAKMIIKGEEKTISNQHEIILFRIIQEFFSNTIKHSKASKLDIIIEYKADNVKFLLSDNGVGFDTENTQLGSGIINIKSRAALINADLKIESNNKGTKVIINYPLKT